MTSSRKKLIEWLLSRIYGVVDGIIAALVLMGIIYLIGVFSGKFSKIIPAWPFKIPIYILVIIFIIILITLIIILIWYSKKKARRTIPNFNIKLAETFDIEHLALSQYIEPDPLLINTKCHFLLIHQAYLIDKNDGYFKLRYKGVVLNKQVCLSFIDSIVGDSAIDSSIMSITVSDRVRKTPLRWRLLKDNPYEKILEIFFHEPLNAGEIFDIEYSCFWPGTFTRNEDYVFYPLHYYKHGVEEFIGEAVLNKPPYHFEGIRFDRKKIELYPIQPKKIKKNTRYILRWKIKKPKSSIYIIKFDRQDI